MTAERPDKVTIEINRARTAVAGLQLRRWAEVEHRLLVRAAPATGAFRSGERGPGIALQVVLRIEDQSTADANRSGVGIGDQRAAIVRLEGLPWRRWAVAPDRIWRAAANNTRRLVRPTVTKLLVPPFQVWLLTGDHSTSGVALDIGYFLRAAGFSDAEQAATGAPGWWSVLSERAAVLVLIAEPPAALTGGATQQTASNMATHHHRTEAMALIAGLRRRTDQPLPSNLFCHGTPAPVSDGQPAGEQAHHPQMFLLWDFSESLH